MFILRSLFGTKQPAPPPEATGAPPPTQTLPTTAPTAAPASQYAPASSAEREARTAQGSTTTVASSQATLNAAGKGPAKAGQTALLGVLAKGLAPIETRLADLRSAVDLGDALKLISGMPELGRAAKKNLVLAERSEKKDQNEAMVSWALGNTRDSALSTYHALYLAEGKDGPALHLRIDDRFLSAGNMDDNFTIRSERRDDAVEAKSAAQVAEAIPGLTPAKLADSVERLLAAR